MSSLFRESALQQLSSPEQLDQVIRITRPRAWIVLSAIGLVLGAALIWSIFGSLPTSITGQGLIIQKGGIFNVVSLGGGVVDSFGPFLPGQKITKGQVLGQVAQPVLSQQLEAANAEVRRLELEQLAVLQEINSERPVQAQSARQQAEVQRSLIASRQELIASNKAKLAQLQSLLADGLITRQRLEDTRQAIISAEAEIANARAALQNIEVQSLGNTSRHAERMRQLSAAVGAARNRVQDLKVQHGMSSQIISPHDGAVVETMVFAGDTINANQPILSVEEFSGKLAAVVYLPPGGEAKLIKAGMPVQLSPVTARKERFGYLVGKVTSVSQYPSTEQGMLALVNNPGLVRELSRSGPPIAVTVELSRDPSTRSGYQWSSEAGANVEISSGTLAAATFTIETQRPISLLIPLLKQTAGL